ATPVNPANGGDGRNIETGSALNTPIPFHLDPRSQRNIQGLEPAVQQAAVGFIRKAKEAGFDIKITSGNRSYAEQNDLFAQGRTRPGPIVTDARGGYSHHNFGLAFDVTLFKNGAIVKDAKEYAKLAPIAASCGLKWGGNWNTMKGDNDHFEW